MSSRSRLSRPLVAVPALALSLAAGLGGALVNAPAAQAAVVTDTCGGVVSDYVGLLGLDAPFIGTVTLPGGGTRDITITPQFLTSTLFKTEITASPTDSRYAIGHITLRVDSLGRGTINFPTFAGGEGETDSVTCPTGTRVTKMTGKVSAAGVSGRLDFSVSRT